jgi:hypothetical protein
VRRALVSGLLLMAGVAVATEASAAAPSYTQQGFIARGSDALRAGPAVRNHSDRQQPFIAPGSEALRAGKDSDSVRQPYPPRFYGDVSRGIKDCRWLMERAIVTNNRNWLQRYRACAQ